MNFDTTKLKWKREPADYAISTDRIEIITAPYTDFSPFKAVFTNMEMSECKWLANDGQQPEVCL